MSWVELAPVLIATIAAAIGWIVAHKANAARDVSNHRREIRVKHLAEIHDVLIELGRNKSIVGNYREVERAISYIHLYGNAEQIELCERFVHDITTTGGANQAELVVRIRNSIREDLGLPIVSTKLNLLKIDLVNKS